MTFWLWTGFLALVAAILYVDLGVLHKHSHRITPGKALRNTGVFVLMALSFAVAIFVIYENQWMGAERLSFAGKPLTGATATIEYLSVWLLEYMLSVDNLFVFTLVFAHFSVPQQHQHRVLFWGILGALILRGAMIGAGSALVAAFHWVLYIFGAILIFTAIKMLVSGDGHFDPARSFTLRIARRLFPITGELHGERFFVRQIVDHRRVLMATPLLLVLLVVEATDVVFAIDSIPVAFGQTREPFIIFTSNVFAIMGLRSLYFALAGLMGMFKYLKVSLSMILVFVGVKMIIEHPVEAIPLSKIPGLGLSDWQIGFAGIDVSAGVSLGVIVSALAVGVIASIMSRRAALEREKKAPDDQASPPS
ncbi:MAG: TerC/Alx family metal homeostasis membrane protein [Phycisphaerales bacterium]